jgi:hypothetical protein
LELLLALREAPRVCFLQSQVTWRRSRGTKKYEEEEKVGIMVVGKTPWSFS